MELKKYEGQLRNLEEVGVEPKTVDFQAPTEIKPEAAQAVTLVTATTPANYFTPTIKQEESPKGIEQANEQATKVVSEVFNQAIVHTVSTDEGVRETLLESAKTVIEDKASAIVDTANTESKLALFKKHEDACSNFGYKEETTPKSLVKQMSAIAYFWNFLYIWTIGTFIVFPITFFCRKISVVIKHSWLAFVFALLVYVLIITVPIFVSWITSL